MRGASTGAGRAALRLTLWGLPLLAAPSATSGDLTVFVSRGYPRDDWADRGYGAALSSTWFQVFSFEGEAARMPGASMDASMTSFTASALLAPPVGLLTPYGGLGIGLFRQSAGAASDTGKLKATILGAKVKLGLVVLKAEYRRMDLSGEPILRLDRRLSAGAGITF